ncbi:MAG TPA: phenylacetate--CoA ligase [Cytophagales bacterium]|jgi:phenylacetate-CoA ligase|nr:phenylacetate--CoA ligase [Cytophagales bacterium]
MSFIPEIETKSKSEIKSFQEELLVQSIHYLKNNSPFYQRHFATHQIDSKKIKTLEKLIEIPPTTKDDLHNFNWDFLCVPRNKISDYTSTSGTLGKPVTIALTEKDLHRLAYNEMISFACADANPNDIFQLMLTLDRQFMAGIAYHEGLRKLGAASIRVGPGSPQMQWDTIQRLKPTGLVAVPSSMLKLIDYCEQNKIDINKSSVAKVVCIGENIRDENLKLNSLSQKISERWQVKLYGTYASTEMQTAFTECSCGRGGHHHPELVILEILNADNSPVREGEVGEVTITTLGVEGMPLLRYKTGDMAQLFMDPCSCGRTTVRLGPILGRKQHMIKLKGTTVYPPAIFDILQQAKSISDFVVEAFTNELGLDDLKISCVSSDEINALKLVKDLFQSRLRVVPEILFTTPKEIEAMQSSPQQRKIQKFIDRRK